MIFFLFRIGVRHVSVIKTVIVGASARTSAGINVRQKINPTASPNSASISVTVEAPKKQ